MFCPNCGAPSDETAQFCLKCGKPLPAHAGEQPSRGRRPPLWAALVALSVVTLDKPEACPPTIAYGVEGKLSFCDSIPSLPGRHTLEDAEAVDFLKTLVNYQHPDRDTDVWPDE